MSSPSIEDTDTANYELRMFQTSNGIYAIYGFVQNSIVPVDPIVP
jgi:hypothetical protein